MFYTLAGCAVDLEHLFPDFRKRNEDGSLGPEAIQNAIVDYTARHVCITRAIKDAARYDGATAATAEKEKHDTYPLAGGHTVVPFAQESFGRLGDVCQGLFCDVAKAAE